MSAEFPNSIMTCVIQTTFQEKHASISFEKAVIKHKPSIEVSPFPITPLPGCYNIFKAEVYGLSINKIKQHHLVQNTSNLY
jgi:hypothetical protein